MPDEGPRPEGWQPTEAFLDATRRFAELRLTEKYRDDEVDYKESLAAVLRRVFSREELEREGVGARVAAFCRGELKPTELGLTPSELKLNEKWPYHASLMNLLGGQYGPIQAGPFTRWAELTPEPEVRNEIREFLYGDVSLAARFDRFSDRLRGAYRTLHAQGQFRSKDVPAVSGQLLATLLGLNEPTRYGLFRVGRYSEAAKAFGYPLAFTGSRGTRYATATRFLADLRGALGKVGVPTDSLVEVHNFVWVSTEPEASRGRWELTDFQALSPSKPQDRARVEAVGAKLERLGKALTAAIKSDAGGAFEHRLLALDYPPAKTSWDYLTESLSERRFGRAHTKRPQLNVEAGADGIDVFFAFHLVDHTPESEFVAPRVRNLAGSGLVAAAIASGYGERPSGERYMIRKRFSPDLAVEWPELGIDAIAEELATLLPIYNAVTGDEPAQPEVAAVDPVFARIDEALRQTGQMILYGPPGTGKTWTASRFAQWWLEQRLGHTPDEANTLQQAGPRERRTWWIVANPQEWRWEKLFETGQEDYRYGRIRANYVDLRKGDLVIGYQATPDKKIVALARIKSPLHDTPAGPKITLEPLRKVVNGLTYEELWEETTLRESEPIRFRNQGTLFRLTATEADLVLARLAERDPSLAELDEEDPRTTVPQVTHVTFHPTYSYEDFVEGYRPVPSTNGQLNLELKPGSFKRVCDAARANSGRDYLVIIDEINRANLPKVFGELITILERDKRGREVTLQNGGQFSVPANVFLIGTMNTADRSIRLLDAAFRRRFAFIECMPDLEPLRGHSVGPLPLDKFLETLNARIREKVGREKQIGQSYLLPNGKPIQTEEEFARHFRFEILPLLQEYAYDDYRQLRYFLGDGLVDEERQKMLLDGMSDHELAIRLANGIARPVEPLPVEA